MDFFKSHLEISQEMASKVHPCIGTEILPVVLQKILTDISSEATPGIPSRITP